MPALPEGFFLAIVFSKVERSKWFSEVFNILALQRLLVEFAQPLKLLPKSPLVVNIAVVEEKYWVVCCRPYQAHVTAHAIMEIVMWNADSIYKTIIVSFQKCCPGQTLQLFLVYPNSRVSASKSKRWACRIDSLLHRSLYFQQRPETRQLCILGPVPVRNRFPQFFLHMCCVKSVPW